MNILIFIIGLLLGVFLRNIVTAIYRTHRKIREAEIIIAKEQERLRKVKKYNYFDDDDQQSQDQIDQTKE